MHRNTAIRYLISAGALGLLMSSALAAGPYSFYSVTPCRVVDTRGATGVNGGPALSSGSARNFSIAGGTCGVPATARAATLNVTMVGPTQSGFLKIWPYNTTRPLVSTINGSAGEPAIANGAIVPFAADPSFQISVVYGTCGPSCPGTADVLIDITGYFQ